jgi:hypothetical protein
LQHARQAQCEQAVSNHGRVNKKNMEELMNSAVTFMENMLETLVKSREAQQKRGDWRKLRK